MNKNNLLEKAVLGLLNPMEKEESNTLFSYSYENLNECANACAGSGGISSCGGKKG